MGWCLAEVGPASGGSGKMEGSCLAACGLPRARTKSVDRSYGGVSDDLRHGRTVTAPR